MKKDSKIEAGCRARTNSEYARRISRTPREMTVLHPCKTISGAWHCQWDGVSVPQIVHEFYLERCAS